MKRVLQAIVWLMLAAAPAYGIDQAPAFEDPVLQDRYDRLTHLLRCLQCRSETIADSNASLAGDLRRETRNLIAAGKTDDEILQFMQERYGDYVLYDPPMNTRTWLLWAAPAMLIGAGVLIAVIVIVRKSRLPDTDPADPGISAP